MLVIDVAHCVQEEVDRNLGRTMGKVEFEYVPDRPYKFFISYINGEVILYCLVICGTLSIFPKRKMSLVGNRKSRSRKVAKQI